MLGIALVLAAGAAVLLFGERADDPLVPGRTAPGFRLSHLGGQGTLELDELRGRVVLLNFWATWCKPCEDEMPAMERLYGRLGQEDFELVAVSVDDDPEAVEAFRRRLGLTFPVLLDPGARVARRYQTTGYPESFLIDRAGILVFKYVGPRDWDVPAYEARVRRLIEAGAAR